MTMSMSSAVDNGRAARCFVGYEFVVAVSNALMDYAAVIMFMLLLGFFELMVDKNLFSWTMFMSVHEQSGGHHGFDCVFCCIYDYLLAAGCNHARSYGLIGCTS